MPSRGLNRSSVAAALAGMLLVPCGEAALAQDSPASGASSTASGPLPGKKNDQTTAPPWAGDLSTRSALLGDIGGLRPLLDAKGISFGLNETTEALGDASGGIARKAYLQGLTQMSVGVDLAKSFGLEGGLFNVSGLQIHNTGLTVDNLGNFNNVSTIEARPATRLNELWYQQTFLGGKVDVKVGQQSGDLEFINSDYESLFINSGFGWPTLPGVDLPSGGPDYPLATLGIRLRARPTDTVTVLIGLFDGSAAGLRPGDPQINDPSGTNFDVSSGYLLISEVQYKRQTAEGLPAAYKFGGWYNSNRFDTPFFNGINGPALQPGQSGPGTRRGDWSLYGIVDQLVYRPAGSEDGGLGVTGRLMGAPSDRNLIDLFAQAGLTYKGAFNRPNDTMGIGVEVAHVSGTAQAGDRATAASLGAFYPTRGSETVFEATYQAQIEPWWTVQPDIQYIVSPGGGVPDPQQPGRRIGDAVVLGLQSTVTF